MGPQDQLVVLKFKEIFVKKRQTDRVGNKLDLKQEYLKFEGIDSQLVGLCYRALVRNIETKDY